MTPQERSVLEGFLAQLAQVRGLNKDPEAERLIARAVEQQPDAAYLVVQRALLLGQALEQAKARIAALEQGEGRGQGFLDPTIPGGGNASGWGNPGSGPAGYRGQPAAAPQYAPAYPPAYGAPPPGYPVYGAPPSGGGFSSFLGQAAATAAGVAGGEFLFQGIENMFGGHHGGGFGGGGYANEALPTEDVTINNYYGPDEVIVDNTIDQPQPDDSDATFSNDDVLGDDQDFV